MNKMKSYTIKVSKALKKNKCNYEYSSLLSTAYNGEGFYINHRKKTCEINKIYGYDKHWAYGGALLNCDFPLSSILSDKESSLGIYAIEFTKIKPRYDNFYYTLYKNNIMTTTQDGKYIIFMTNIDYEIFQDLYITDATIIKKKWFKDIGKLSALHDIILDAYKDKKSSPIEDKPIFEAAFYGLFARKLNKSNEFHSIIEFKKAYSETGDEDIRSNKVPIAMFQSAYLRYEEWQLFKKYMNNVVYMNTDSIYTDRQLDINIKNEIGHYDIEFVKNVQWIRRNAYVVLNDDNTIYKSVIGGCINGGDITQDKLNKLKQGESVKAMTKDIDGNIIEIDLKPQFILSQAGVEPLMRD